MLTLSLLSFLSRLLPLQPDQIEARHQPVDAPPTNAAATPFPSLSRFQTKEEYKTRLNGTASQIGDAQKRERKEKSQSSGEPQKEKVQSLGEQTTVLQQHLGQAVYSPLLFQAEVDAAEGSPVLYQTSLVSGLKKLKAASERWKVLRDGGELSAAWEAVRNSRKGKQGRRGREELGNETFNC